MSMWRSNWTSYGSLKIVGVDQRSAPVSRMSRPVLRDVYLYKNGGTGGPTDTEGLSGCSVDKRWTHRVGAGRIGMRPTTYHSVLRVHTGMRTRASCDRERR